MEKAGAPAIDMTGTWRLLQVRAFDTDGREVTEHEYGPEPWGMLQVSPHRMQGTVGDGRAALPSGVKRFWASYTGPYTFDGKTLITTVQDTNLADRQGSQQVRDVRAEGETVWLSPPARAVNGRTIRYELQWERLAS